MNRYKTEVKWSIIFVVVMLLWMGFERLIGLHDEHIANHAIYTNFFAIFAIAVYVFALRDKKKTHYGGEMTWNQGFMTGLIITIIVALLTPLVQWITHTIITPDFFENIRAYSVEQGMMTQEEAEGYFSLSGYIVQSMIGALGMGIITSAIVAFFTRTKRT
ncbi:MAG TPA: DUF4199 domain-containing protein [Balneolaceae bacterium]|nr:DUF4199 domain-containing protein [Balneolaceae bacterium]